MGLKTIALGAGCFALLAMAATPQTAGLSPADQAFLKMAADTDMTEANLGQAAQQKASETGVKDYGQKLVQDHTNDYRELQELAKKVGATIPNGIDIAKNHPAEQVLRLKGQQFDHRFVESQVRDHERAIAAYKREAQRGKDADVKAYASKAIPGLESHLHIAQDLAKAKGNLANTASAFPLLGLLGLLSLGAGAGLTVARNYA